MEPLDYEGELVTRRKELEKEQFLNLLLFPQQDVTVSVCLPSPRVNECGAKTYPLGTLNNSEESYSEIPSVSE